MQFYRAQQYYRLLDLKTMTEYLAANDGYTLQRSKSEGTGRLRYSVRNSSYDRARLSRALFTVLQRVTLSQIAANLNLKIGEELQYIEEYLRFFQIDNFRAFLLENQSSICGNPFAGEVMSEKDYTQLCSTLLDDIIKYNAYMQGLSHRLYEEVVRLKQQGDTVLGAYARIPQLVVGLIKRAYSQDKYNSLADESIAASVEPDFFQYCSMLSFDEENNCETIVEKYLGSMMGFFLKEWFVRTVPKMVTSKVLVGGKDSKSIYISDSQSLPLYKEAIMPEVYPTFKKVMDLDCRMFRMKKNVDDNPTPYYSLVDFVISVQAQGICNQLNAELAEASIPIKFSLYDTLRTDLALCNRDASFQYKVKNYKAEIAMLYDKAKDLTLFSFKDAFMNIISYFESLAGDHKDSNKAYVEYSEVTPGDNGAVYLMDSAYAKFGEILDVIGTLTQMDTALNTRGLTLAYVWQQALDQMTDYNSGVFDNKLYHKMWKMSKHLNNNLSDGFVVEPLKLYVSPNTTYEVCKTCQSVMNRSYKVPDKQLQNARLITLPVEQYNQKGVVLACSQVITSCMKMLPSEVVGRDTLRSTLDFVFRFLGLSGLTPDKSSITVEQVYDLETEKVTPFKIVCGILTTCFNYAEASQTFSSMYNSTMHLFHICREVFPDETSTAWRGWLDSQDYQERQAQYQHYSEFLIYDNVLRELQAKASVGYTFFQNGEGATSEEHATKLFLNCVDAIAYLVYVVLDSCVEDVQNIHDVKLAVDLFILVLDLTTALHEAASASLQVFKESLSRLKEINGDFSAKEQALLSNVFTDNRYLADKSLSKLESKYTVEQALQLAHITDVFSTVDTVFFSELKKLASLRVDYISQGLDAIEHELGCLIPAYSLLLNLNYLCNGNYAKIVGTTVQGAIRRYSTKSFWSQLKQYMNVLEGYQKPLITYVSDYVGLTKCQIIPRHSGIDKNRGNYVQNVLLHAVDTEGFRTKRLIRTNLSVSAQLEYRLFRKQLVEDIATGFLMRSHDDYYSVYNSSGKILYYMHAAGVLVGYDTEKSDYSFLTFEEARKASIIEG